jgi:hypothetical protein
MTPLFFTGFPFSSYVSLYLLWFCISDVHYALALIAFSQETYVTYVDSKGQVKVQGGKDLHGTQEYTAALGEAFASLWERHKAELQDEAPRLRDKILHMEPVTMDGMDWGVAVLDPVIAFLESARKPTA